jgi:hypothetical protein
MSLEDIYDKKDPELQKCIEQTAKLDAINTFRDEVSFRIFGYRNYYSDRDIFERIAELRYADRLLKSCLKNEW